MSRSSIKRAVFSLFGVQVGLFIAALWLFLWWGMGRLEASQLPASPQGHESLSVKPLSEETPLLEVPITPFVTGSMQQVVSAYSDQRFILHFWSVDCGPCRNEMPMWQALMQDHPELPVVFVSTDAEVDTEEVQATLASLGVSPTASWQFDDPFVEKLRFEVDPRWRGELPRSYFYLPGQKPQGVSGAIARELIDQWLRFR